MTASGPCPDPIATPAHPTRTTVKGSTLLGLLQTIGHQVIGMLYPVTSMTPSRDPRQHSAVPLGRLNPLVTVALSSLPATFPQLAP